MSRVPPVARAFAIFGAALAVAALAPSCKSADGSAPAPATLCSDAKAAAKTCTTPADCDAALTSACKDLASVVSASAIDATMNCLESGVCGVSSCLQRSQKSATAGAAHQQLAADYCSSCAPNDDTCPTSFYSKGTKLPGVLALPYSDDVVSQIDQNCTGTAGCAAKFASCMNDTVTQATGAALDEATAACVTQAFQHDDDGATQPDGTPVVAKCTAQTCSGCCKDDVCQQGDQLNACGSGASACQVCAGAQQCTAGKCKEPCGPNNCRGCCDGDACIDGTATAKCGAGGAACAPCTTGNVCSKGTCIDGSCQATCLNGCCSAAGCQAGTAATACGTGAEACVSCGAGRACTAGACVLDQTSLWDFYVSFAIIPETDKDGSSWDALGGAPDPYLIAYTSQGTDSTSGITSTQTDTTVPFWAETPLVGIKASELLSNLSFELWDSDDVFDDFIGGCAIPVTAALFDGSLQSIDCPATPSGVAVTLYYRINPHGS